MTPRQAHLLRFIKTYQAASDGCSPSFDEMKEALGLRSKSGVHKYLTRLEEGGFILRRHFRARAIELIDPAERYGLHVCPHCGKPLAQREAA